MKKHWLKKSIIPLVLVVSLGFSVTALAEAVAPDGKQVKPGDKRQTPIVLQPVKSGSINNPELKENSGIVVSKIHPNVYYSHNDSGDSARFFGINDRGQLLATYELKGATALDWEDIAVGPGPSGKSYVYIGDIGDNNLFRDGAVHTQPNGTTKLREKPSIYRLAEPEVPNADKAPDDPSQAPTVQLTKWEKIVVQYPDGFNNCEAMFVDPISGDLFLVIKNRKDEDEPGTARVYKARAESMNKSAMDGSVLTLEYVANIKVSANSTKPALATGADISTDGEKIIIKNPQEAFMWYRDKGQTVDELFQSEPTAPYYLPISIGDSFQIPGKGEAIAFNFEGTGFYTSQEGIEQPLWFYEINQRRIDPPKHLSATVEPSGVVNLTWQAPMNSTVVKYNIYAGKELIGEVKGMASEQTYSLQGAINIFMPSSIPETSFEWNSGDESKKQLFSVKAVDLLGNESPSSNHAVVR